MGRLRRVEKELKEVKKENMHLLEYIEHVEKGLMKTIKMVDRQTEVLTFIRDFLYGEIE